MSISPRGAGLLFPARRVLWVALLTAWLAGITLLAFRRWMPGVWLGDDLANYFLFVQKGFASNPIQSLTQPIAEKYRPVYALAMEAVFTGFGTNLRHYMHVNVLLNAVNGALSAVIAFRLSRSRVVAALAATAMVLSRFMLYQVTQVTGLLEGVGFLLFLAALWAVVDLHTREDDGRGGVLGSALLAVAAGWLLVFDHERYLPAIPWLAVMLWIAPGVRRLSSDSRQGLVAALLAAVAVNLGYKKYVINAAVMVGTGGTRIALDVAGMAVRLKQGVLSVFGVNDGPTYLVGHSVTERPFTAIGFCALIFIATLIALAVLAVRRLSAGRREPRPWPYLLPASFAVLAGLLLIPPMLTIRMEQRWLVEPFALVILSAAWCAGRVGSRRLAAALFGVLAAASVIVDLRLSVAFPEIYMVKGEREALNVKRAIVDPGAPDRVEIVADADVCQWVLLKGDFFRMYAPRTRSECVTAPDKLPPLLYKAPDRPPIFMLQPDETFKDDSYRIYLTFARRDEAVRYDFAQMFPQGRINDDQHMDTPSGKGAVLMPYHEIFVTEPGLVVVSSFAYRYEGLEVRPGDRLEFDLAMAFATKTESRARARIIVQPEGGAPDVIYESMVPRRRPGEEFVFSDLSIPLGRYTKPVTITFAADTPVGDPAGHWVVFAAPRIVHDRNSP